MFKVLFFILHNPRVLLKIFQVSFKCQPLETNKTCRRFQDNIFLKDFCIFIDGGFSDDERSSNGRETVSITEMEACLENGNAFNR